MQDRDGASGFNPKHRIIGAVILVIAAVVAVPLLLNREEPPEPPTENVESNATIVDVPPLGELPAPPITAAPTPVAPTAPTAPASPEALPSPSADTTPQSASGAIAPNVAIAPAQKPEPTPATTKPAAARTPVVKGWYVQVGTFANEANAKALAARLKERGYKVRLDDARVGGKRALRVQVGPYSQNVAAARARQEIERKLQVKGVVRAL